MRAPPSTHPAPSTLATSQNAPISQPLWSVAQPPTLHHSPTRGTALHCRSCGRRGQGISCSTRDCKRPNTLAKNVLPFRRASRMPPAAAATRERGSPLPFCAPAPLIARTQLPPPLNTTPRMPARAGCQKGVCTCAHHPAPPRPQRRRRQNHAPPTPQPRTASPLYAMRMKSPPLRQTTHVTNTECACSTTQERTSASRAPRAFGDTRMGRAETAIVRRGCRCRRRHCRCTRRAASAAAHIAAAARAGTPARAARHATVSRLTVLPSASSSVGQSAARRHSPSTRNLTR